MDVEAILRVLRSDTADEALIRLGELNEVEKRACLAVVKLTLAADTAEMELEEAE